MSSPKAKMLTLPAFVAKNSVGSFLEPKDLCAVAQTCRQKRDTYKNNCKASEVLFYGLNINKDRKKKLCELLATQKLEEEFVVLTRVNGRQVYFSKKIDGTACLRTLANLSPLEAAVICGDFHLVQLFLDSRLSLLNGIPDKQYQEAILQLKGIREKLESDPRSFISLIIQLQKIYKEFIDNSQSLVDAKNWDELDRLSGLIGENQKTLPWFILQLFCKDIPHVPLPDFTQKPERECFLFGDHVLDLDTIGVETKSVLYKMSSGIRGVMHACGVELLHDSLALGSMSSVIKSELDKIIKLQEQKLMLAAYPNPEQSASPNPKPRA